MLLELAVLAAAGASPPLEPLSAGAVSCTSVILRWPAATGRQPPVLEFAVWMLSLIHISEPTRPY